MSDLFETRKKVEEGAKWRGTITIKLDGEQQELTVRQLRDPEFWDVMTSISMDEIEALQVDLPDDEMEEFRELQDSDDLDDEEQARLEELQAKVEEDVDVFDTLSYETYEGIKQAGKYGVVPDEGDIQTALSRHTSEIEEEYGDMSNESARQYVQDYVVDPMVEESTDLASVAIGIKALGETLGESGN